MKDLIAEKTDFQARNAQLGNQIAALNAELTAVKEEINEWEEGSDALTVLLDAKDCTIKGLQAEVTQLRSNVAGDDRSRRCAHSDDDAVSDASISNQFVDGAAKTQRVLQ